MDLSKLHNIDTSKLWQGACQFPWMDPSFSQRLLKAHLKYGQDWVSRHSRIIGAQVGFLEDKIFHGETGARVLDLGCGPGHYCRAFAQQGHTCTGVDISPALIQYAKTNDASSKYIEGDFQFLELGNGYDLILFLYGAINRFLPDDARDLITRLRDAAWPGGTLIIEVFNERQIEDMGRRGATWKYQTHGVFLDSPHLCLEDHVWSEEQRTAMARYFVLGEDASTSTYTQTLYAYRDHEYIEMLQEIGARRIGRYPSLSDDAGMSFLIAGV